MKTATPTATQRRPNVGNSLSDGNHNDTTNNGLASAASELGGAAARAPTSESDMDLAERRWRRRRWRTYGRSGVRRRRLSAGGSAFARCIVMGLN